MHSHTSLHIHTYVDMYVLHMIRMLVVKLCKYACLALNVTSCMYVYFYNNYTK